MTHWEKMLSGMLYEARDPHLCDMRVRARRILNEYNRSHPDDVPLRKRLLEELLSKRTRDVSLEPPFHCDFGVNIELGDGSFVHTGCVFLDCAPIRIGKNCIIGPGVKLSAVTHPIDPELRLRHYEYGDAIVIGDNVLLEAGVTVNPGATVGDNAVVTAGSVVTKDVPPNAVAGGVPCRVLRFIGETDREEIKNRY